MRTGSGFRIAPNLPYIGKMTMTSQLSKNLLIFFYLAVFLLSTLVTGQKFHVNIMTGVKKIFAYKRLTRNLEIVNTPV